VKSQVNQLGNTELQNNDLNCKIVSDNSEMKKKASSLLKNFKDKYGELHGLSSDEKEDKINKELPNFGQNIN
jgi:hypothetical protein